MKTQYQIRLHPLRFNVYVCQSCTLGTTTVDIHEGCTPFMIGCPACNGSATSAFYPKGPIPASIPDPSLEWFKPEGADYRKLDAATKEHVRMGGLIDRGIPAEHEAAVMMEFRARRAPASTPASVHKTHAPAPAENQNQVGAGAESADNGSL